jgi:methionyl-tRNA synthetase
MLMAIDMPLPRNIFAHGWWTVEGKKMSKSIGNVVDPNEVVQTYGVDAFRYFLFREVPFGLDGDFSIDAIVGRINSDLANDLGNLVSRVITMAGRYFDGTVPQPDGTETELKKLAEGILDDVVKHLDCLAFQRALNEIWTLVTYLNKYIDTNQPWSLAKDPGMRGRLATVIYSTLEGLRFIALYIYPFMPSTAEKIYRGIGIKMPIEEGLLSRAEWGGLKPGSRIEKPEPLFPRISPKLQEETGKPPKDKKERHSGKESGEKRKQSADTSSTSLIGIEDFAKVELKVGRIIEAEKVEGSKKLLKLKVDTGEERQIVAGIANAYEPDALVGKQVVVVTNLKPARLMGIESQGMLLAAGDGKTLAILSPDKDVKEGTRVK